MESPKQKLNIELEEVCHFYDDDTINIKLMTGEMFHIKINNILDNEKKLIEKILYHGNKSFDYKFRKHRIKIFKYEDDQHNKIDEKECTSTEYLKKIFYNLKDNDTLYLFSESPLDHKIIKTEYFFNPTNTYNYFHIKNEKDYFDAIDRLDLEIYDKDLPLFFDIENVFFFDNYQKEYTESLFKNIFDKKHEQNIHKVFFKCYFNYYDFYSYFITYLIKYYRDLDTIGLDFYCDQSDFINKLFDALKNTKNICMSSNLFMSKDFNISFSYTINTTYINLYNTENLYIFKSITDTRNINSCDFYFEKIKSFNDFNHNIFINYKNSYRTLKLTVNTGWVKQYTDLILDQNNIYLYKHVSKVKDEALFSSENYLFI